ncbi:MAG TPA: hypothetical protein VNJ01_01005 [Bacteriovoracaceae bacterium]|nr:hypothetical protein [Bacteriovoracaceae bacterium]
MLNKIKNALLLALVYPCVLHAYPVFYKCGPKGAVSMELTDSELSDQLSKLMASLDEDKIYELSSMGSSCMKDFKRLAGLNAVLNKINPSQFESEYSKILSDAALRSERIKRNLRSTMNSVSSDDVNNIIDSIVLVSECRTASSRAARGSENAKYCPLAHFNHSPYSYVTGSRNSGALKKHHAPTKSSPLQCKDLNVFVTNAVTSGQDPYAALAVTLMENGLDINSLYLDPVGEVQTMGCGFSSGTKQNHNLESFETYYNVKYGVVKNDFLLTNIKNNLKLKKITLEPGSSFACVGGKDAASIGLSFSQTAVANRCCMQLPYNLNEKVSIIDPEGEAVNNALTYASLEKYIKPALVGTQRGTNPQEYPARRLQRFNGWSDSMGGAESVSPWRSSVNLFTHPMYGFQAVDFILNTLWNNPQVRGAVQRAETNSGVSSASVMCMDSKPGVYSVDHQLFFKKVSEAPRMGSIKARWRQAGSWKFLKNKDQRILTQELLRTCAEDDSIDQFCKLQKADPKKVLDNVPVVDKAVETYFSRVYKLRSTVRLANESDEGFSWNPLSDVQWDFMQNNVLKIVNKIL